MKQVFILLLCIPIAACSRFSPKSSFPSHEGFVDVPGGKVWYRVVGTGNATPLVLLHGGPGFSSDYLTRLNALADERPVVFYDQLGAGKSERPKDRSLWTMERFVTELAAIREKLGLKQVHILGHSWGTMLLMDYMLTKPAGVHSLIMSSPAISSPRWLQDANRFRGELPADVQAVLKKHEDDGTFDSEEYQNAVNEYYHLHLIRSFPLPPEVELTMKNENEDIYQTMWGPSEFFGTGTLKDYDRTPQLHELKVPVLFTAGRYDEATPETTRYYQTQVPDSTMVIFENSSHMAMIEETDRYVQIVRDFLHRIESRN